MKRFMHGLLATALSASVLAIEEPSRSNVSTTTWEIYGFVALVFVVGFGYVFWHQNKEKERKQRRER